MSECSLTYSCGRDSPRDPHVCRRPAHRPDRRDRCRCCSSTAGPSPPSRSPRPPASQRARSSGSSTPRTTSSTAALDHAFDIAAVPRRPAPDRARPAAARTGLGRRDPPSDPLPRHLRADDGGRHGRPAERAEAPAPPTARRPPGSWSTSLAPARGRARRTRRRVRPHRPAADLLRHPSPPLRRSHPHDRGDRRHRPRRPAPARTPDAASPRPHPPRALQGTHCDHRDAPVHRHARDALPPEHQRRDHRQGRRHRRHRLHRASAAA